MSEKSPDHLKQMVMVMVIMMMTFMATVRQLATEAHLASRIHLSQLHKLCNSNRRTQHLQQVSSIAQFGLGFAPIPIPEQLEDAWSGIALGAQWLMLHLLMRYRSSLVLLYSMHSMNLVIRRIAERMLHRRTREDR